MQIDNPTLRTLLIFDLGDTRFGVDAALVRESIWLPELIPFEAAPLHIDGIFSLRGRIIPVTDLNLRFGHPARPHLLSDQIVILELNQLLMGLIVSEVIEVVEISAEAILPPPEFDGETHRYAHLLLGEVRVGDDIVMLLDASQLMFQPPDLVETDTDTENISPARLFCPEATPEEHAVFRARAKALMQVASEEEGASLPLAVVEMEGEYFGIELQAVLEFCDIIQPSPIPCCPPHILGAICLRGNLLTLLDMRAALNLPRAQQSNCKAVVVLLGDQRVGVAVDQVHDVIYLREDELLAAPLALREQHASEIRGTAAYGGKLMAVLNLPVLLAREEWVVNEIV
jgi:purine-binding chemotaxis protein CheW